MTFILKFCLITIFFTQFCTQGFCSSLSSKTKQAPIPYNEYPIYITDWTANGPSYCIELTAPYISYCGGPDEAGICYQVRPGSSNVNFYMPSTHCSQWNIKIGICAYEGSLKCFQNNNTWSGSYNVSYAPMDTLINVTFDAKDPKNSTVNIVPSPSSSSTSLGEKNKN